MQRGMESEVAPVAVVVGANPKLEKSLEAAQVALQRVVQHLVLEQLEEAVDGEEREEEATVVVVADVEGVDGEEDAVAVVGAEEEEVVVRKSEEASLQRLR